MGLLEELQTRVLTADGAIGTLLYSYGLDYCHEEMNIARPDIIEKFIVNILRQVRILFRQIHTELTGLSLRVMAMKIV